MQIGAQPNEMAATPNLAKQSKTSCQSKSLNAFGAFFIWACSKLTNHERTNQITFMIHGKFLVPRKNFSNNYQNSINFLVWCSPVLLDVQSGGKVLLRVS
jgi:hypothetical protein